MPPATRIEPGFHPYAPPTAELEVPAVDYRKVDAVRGGQRLILLAMVAAFALGIAMFVWPPTQEMLVVMGNVHFAVRPVLVSGMTIVYVVATFTGLFRVMRGLDKSWFSCGIWLFAFCWPRAHLIVLGVINQQATNFLRGAGLKVGFLGAARRSPAPRVER